MHPISPGRWGILKEAAAFFYDTVCSKSRQSILSRAFSILLLILTIRKMSCQNLCPSGLGITFSVEIPAGKLNDKAEDPREAAARDRTAAEADREQSEVERETHF